MKAAGEDSRKTKPAAWVTPSALFCIGRFIRFIESFSDKAFESTRSRRIHVLGLCTPLCFMRFDLYFSSGDPCDNRLQCADFPSSGTSYTRASNSICYRYSPWKLPRIPSYYTTLPTTTYVLPGPPCIPLRLAHVLARLLTNSFVAASGLPRLRAHGLALDQGD
jgi:hypothetical protein